MLIFCHSGKKTKTIQIGEHVPTHNKRRALLQKKERKIFSFSVLIAGILSFDPSVASDDEKLKIELDKGKSETDNPRIMAHFCKS